MLEKSPDARNGFDVRRCERVGLESGDASVMESWTIFGTLSKSSLSLLSGIVMGSVDTLGLAGGAGCGACSLVWYDIDDVQRNGSKSSRRLSHPTYMEVACVCECVQVYVCVGVGGVGVYALKLKA